MNKNEKGYLERIAEVVEMNAGIVSPTEGQKNEEGYLERIAVGAELGGIGGGGGGGTPVRYQAGDNIQINGLIISAPNVATKAELNAQSTTYDQDLQVLDAKIDTKQNTLTAGQGINIVGNVISSLLNSSNVYSKSEVDALLNALDTLQMEVVAVKPATGQPDTIYLVGNDTDGYVQWVYLTSGWVSLGSTEVNLSAYPTSAEISAQYQKKLTAGDGINISASNVISTTLNPSTAYNKTEINNLMTNKQDKLTAGTGISISGSTISAMRNPDNTYLKAEVDGKLNNKQNTLTAGTGITISGNTISGRDSYTKTETDTLLNAKQAKLTAGDGITISSANVISATGGGGGTSDVTLTEGTLVYTSNWKSFPPAQGGTKPVPTKISFGTTASIVQLYGDFCPKVDLSTGYDGIVASLPDGFEPSGYVRVKGHYGNSDYSWLLTITPDGDCRFSNFPMSVPSDNKFSFSAMWIRKSG